MRQIIARRDEIARVSNDGRIGEKKLPRAVEIEPALVAEPTGGERGNVQEGMAAHADHFSAVPAEEGLRGEAYGGWVGDTAKAYRTAVALVGKGPAEAHEADGEAGDELQTLGGGREAGGVAVRDVERGEETDTGDKKEFAGEE